MHNLSPLWGFGQLFCMVPGRCPGLSHCGPSARNRIVCGWQTLCAFAKARPDLEKYRDHQAEHHRAESFQDEFRRLLKNYGIEFDERYVWD